MPAILINLKIDHKEKFDFLKVTIADLTGLFEECHVKIRGTYSKECIEYIRGQFGNEVEFYQEIQESDWVAATLEMLDKVKSRSVFLYFEDHRLVAGRLQLKKILGDFDEYNLDYLCYSFFRASQLNVKNLLPLGVIQRELFHEFDLSEKNIALVGKISPGFYTFSLISLISVKYFREVLAAENKKCKIFGRKVTSLITRLFPYPRYRALLKTINHVLSPLGARLCIYPPSSPFNLEKMWFESSLPIGGSWQFGTLKQELFANYDDDNGAFGESLIKRGLYPFDAYKIDAVKLKAINRVEHKIKLCIGEFYDCTYYSHNGRIRHTPVVSITVVNGRVAVDYMNESFQLYVGDSKLFYSNMSPIIRCLENSEILIKVFDEIFN